MNKKTTKLALAGVFTAVAVIGSLISIPVAGSKCAPVQHMVNIFSAVLLGPWWGIAIAFVASLLWTRKFSCFSGKHDRRVLLWYCLLFLSKDQSDLYSRSTWYRIFRWTCGCSCCKVAYADSGRRSFCLCDPVLYLYVCRQYFIICNIFCLKKEWKPHTITGNGT